MTKVKTKATTKPKKKRWDLLTPQTCKYCRQRFSWKNTTRYISHLRHHELWMLPHWFYFGKMKQEDTATVTVKPKRARAKKPVASVARAPKRYEPASQKLVIELTDIFGWRNKRKTTPHRLHGDSTPFEPMIGVDARTIVKRKRKAKWPMGVEVTTVPFQPAPCFKRGYKMSDNVPEFVKKTETNETLPDNAKSTEKKLRGRPRKEKASEPESTPSNPDPVIKKEIEDMTFMELYKLTNNRNHLAVGAPMHGAALNTSPVMQQSVGEARGPSPTIGATGTPPLSPDTAVAAMVKTQSPGGKATDVPPLKTEIADKKPFDFNNNPLKHGAQVKSESADSKDGLQNQFSPRKRPKKQTTYPCQYCPRIFSRKLARKYHEAVHTGEKNFKCQFCEMTFIQPATKFKHEMSHFGLTKTHKCRHCEAWFAGTHARRIHEMVQHTGVMTYDCRACDAQFTSIEEKKSHERAHRDERRHKCGFCPKAFKTIAHKKNHERIHTGEKPFECQYCKKRFIQLAMKQRCERKHTGEKFPCKYCDKEFARPEARNDHEKIHEGDTTFACNVCGKIFDNGRSLKLHDMTHRGEKPHKCDYCEKRFTRKEHKKFHEKLHTGLGYFKCRFCPKQFRGKHDHKRHENTHTFETVYRCSFCSMGFSSSTGQRRHERTHLKNPKYRCEQCDKLFETPSHLRRHMKVHTDERPYKCGICNKSFRSAESAKHHEQSVHLKIKKHKCNFCEATFVNNSGRRYHEAAKHTGEKSFQCQFCDKTFAWPNQKTFHERKVHTGEGMFDCSACGKKFVTKAFADIHFNKKHAKNKPFNCSYCQHGFGTRARLENHELSHTGQFSFHCDICPERFTNAGALSDHAKEYHPNGIDIKCKNCEKRFKKELSKKAHERLHTKKDPLACATCGMKYCLQTNLNRHNQQHHTIVKKEKSDQENLPTTTNSSEEPLPKIDDYLKPVLATIAQFEESTSYQGVSQTPVLLGQEGDVVKGAPNVVPGVNLESVSSPVRQGDVKKKSKSKQQVNISAVSKPIADIRTDNIVSTKSLVLCIKKEPLDKMKALNNTSSVAVPVAQPEVTLKQSDSAEPTKKRKYVRRNVKPTKSKKMDSVEPKKKRNYVRKNKAKDSTDSQVEMPISEASAVSKNDAVSETPNKRKSVRKNSKATESDTPKSATASAPDNASVAESKKTNRKCVRKNNQTDDSHTTKKVEDKASDATRVVAPAIASSPDNESVSESKEKKRKYVRRNNQADDSHATKMVEDKASDATRVVAPKVKQKYIRKSNRASSTPATRAKRSTAQKAKKALQKAKKTKRKTQRVSSTKRKISPDPFSKKRPRITLKIKFPKPPTSEKSKSQNRTPPTKKGSTSVETTTNQIDSNQGLPEQAAKTAQIPLPKDNADIVLKDTQACATLENIVAKLKCKSRNDQTPTVKKTLDSNGLDGESKTIENVESVSVPPQQNSDILFRALMAPQKPQSNADKLAILRPNGTEPVTPPEIDDTPSTPSSAGVSECSSTTSIPFDAAITPPIATKTGGPQLRRIFVSGPERSTVKQRTSALKDGALDLSKPIMNETPNRKSMIGALDLSVKKSRWGPGRNNSPGMIGALDLSMKRPARACKKTQGIPVDKLLLTRAPNMSQFSMLGRTSEFGRLTPMSPAIIAEGFSRGAAQRIVGNPAPKPGQYFSNLMQQPIPNPSNMW